MISDTSEEVRDRHAAMLAAMSPEERFARMLALSAFVRHTVWAGAQLHAGARGRPAVVARFLDQMYGDSLSKTIRDQLIG